jgi:hypothetical protein
METSAILRTAITAKPASQYENTGMNENILGSPHETPYHNKLTIAPSNDPLENDADRMADKVMRMPITEQINFSPAKSNINRKCAHCEEEEEKQLQRQESNSDSISIAPPIVHEVLNSSSSKSLDPDTLSFMESRFNYDFNDVKIHDNDLAAKSAGSINALAYTSGNNIVFNSGGYNTSSESGKRLLAHELTHVVQQANNVNRKVQRFSQTRFLDDPEKDTAADSTASKKVISVDRIVKPGDCKIIPETRVSSDYGADAQKSFFRYSNCRGGRSIETAGELDYGQFVTNAGNFVSGLLNNPLTPFNTLLNQTIGSSTLKGNLSFVFRLNSFRMELGAQGSATPSGNLEGKVSGLIRYTDGKFAIELAGDTTAFKDALQTGRVSNVVFNTDLGPMEIRFNLTQGKPLGASSDSLTIDGSVSYRPSSTAYGVGVNVQQVNGVTQFIFSFRVNLGGKIPQETAPDCNTCECTNPEITYECRERSNDDPKPDPDPLPKMLPYYFDYSNTESRPDWTKQNADTITQIVELIKDGYTISSIEGYCSPEGEAELAKPTRSGFPGNMILSRQRAERSGDDIKNRLRVQADWVSDKQPAGKKARERITASLNSNYLIIPQGELFGSTLKGKEVKRPDLFKHLTTTLKAPSGEAADPLEQANVIGQKLPAEVNEAAAIDIEEFRTGQSGDKKLSRDQRLEELYKWLRRSLIYLSPPIKEPKPFDKNLRPDYLGKKIDCTDKYINIFNGVSIPPEELFVNHCDKK